ncbi:SDR family NAD(P)-dependent oxidoreductase [Candidatus Bathyarchaeota archaeon]|nr:SDR family NAD(P)-dependent oxidoreductase [Candidatus Bathyarchaeota archaeon]
MLLKDKNIVITGSGRGIGKHVAIACAKEGANVCITSRTIDELNDVKEEIEQLGNDARVLVHPADITKIDEVESMFKGFQEELGPLNAVVANAGWSRRSVTHEFSSETFASIMNVNVLGVFNTFKASYPCIKLDEKKNPARFIITGSAAYPTAMPKFAAYTASKYAVVGFMKALELEYRKDYITFNMILPTMVDTQLLRGKKAGDGQKPPTVMDPWDLNDYYVFLMTDWARKVSGYLLDISELEKLKQMVLEAPEDAQQDEEKMKDYLKEKDERFYKQLRKLRNLASFFLEKC